MAVECPASLTCVQDNVWGSTRLLNPEVRKSNNQDNVMSTHIAQGREFSVVSPVVRCVATHVNPTSGETDIDLVEQLRTVFDRTTMGTYLVVARGGLLKVGDEMKAS